MLTLSRAGACRLRRGGRARGRREPPGECLPGGDADEGAVRGGDRDQALAWRLRQPCRERREELLGDHLVPGQGHRRLGDDVADEERLERVGGVLAGQVEPAAGDLLGEDRALEHEGGQGVGAGGGDQQRQETGPGVGELEGEYDAGQRGAHDAADDGGEPEPSPRSRRKTCGRAMPSAAPRAPPIMKTGASTPPEVPDPSDSDQISVLTMRMPTMRETRGAPGEQLVDDVVADAERARLGQAAQADDGAADGGPPHPVDGQLVEGVFGPVDEPGGGDGEGAAGEPGDERRARSSAPVRCIAGSHGEDRAGCRAGSRGRWSATRPAATTGMKLRGRHSNSSSSTASSTEAMRRVEGGRHAAGGAGHQQGLALVGGEVAAAGR